MVMTKDRRATSDARKAKKAVEEDVQLVSMMPNFRDKARKEQKMAEKMRRKWRRRPVVISVVGRTTWV